MPWYWYQGRFEGSARLEIDHFNGLGGSRPYDRKRLLVSRIGSELMLPQLSGKIARRFLEQLRRKQGSLFSFSGHCRHNVNVRNGRICGRRAFGKRFLLVYAGWLLAGICSAFLGGVRIPRATMRIASEVPNKRPHSWVLAPKWAVPTRVTAASA